MAMLFSNKEIISAEPLTSEELTLIIKNLASSPSGANMNELARAIVLGTRAAFNEEELLSLIEAFQSVKPLNYADICLLKDRLIRCLAEFAAIVMRATPDMDEMQIFLDKQNAARAAKAVEIIDISLSRINEFLMTENVGIYRQMTADSREGLVREIARLANKYGISEFVLAESAVALANENNAYVGGFIFDRLGETLFSVSGRKPRILSEDSRQRLYSYSILILSFFVSIAVMFLFSGGIVAKLIVGQLAFFVSFSVVKSVFNSIFISLSPARLIPSIALENVGKEDSTLVLLIKEAACEDDIRDAKTKIEELERSISTNNTDFAVAFLLPPSSVYESTADHELIKYANSIISNCFFAARQRVARRFVSRNNALLLHDICGCVLNKGDKLLSSNYLGKPRNIITLADTDSIDSNAVLQLIGASKHPQNKKYNIFALSEQLDTVATKRTAFTQLFADSRGVYTDIVSAREVYGEYFDAGVFNAPVNVSGGLVRVEGYYDACLDTLPDKPHASFILASGIAGTARTAVPVSRKYPKTFISYFRRMQGYVFGAFQLIKYIYIKPRNKKGERLKLSPLYSFMILEEINNSLMYISTYLLLLTAIISGEYFLPLLLVACLYLTMPLISLFEGNLAKSITRSIVSFSLLPITFFLSLSSLASAIFSRAEPYSPANKTAELVFAPSLIASTIFILIGGRLGLFCAAFWLIGLIAYYPLNRTRLSPLPAKRSAVLTEFGLIEPSLRIDKTISRIEFITQISETAKYNMLYGGGYTVISDEIARGLSTYKTMAINKFNSHEGCGTKITVDGAAIPSSAIFARDYTTHCYKSKTHDTQVKTILLYANSGELKHFLLTNKTSGAREYTISITTDYALSELDRENNSTEYHPDIRAEILLNTAKVSRNGIAVAEIIDMADSDITFENNTLTITISLKLDAGQTKEFVWMRLAESDEIALNRAINKTKTYGYTSAVLRNFSTLNSYQKTQEESSDLAYFTRREVLSKLMSSGTALRRAEYFSALTRTLNGSDDAFRYIKGFFVLIKLEKNGKKDDISAVVSALESLYKSGLKFSVAFLFEEEGLDSKALLTLNTCGLRYFLFDTSNLSKTQADLLEYGANTVIDLGSSISAAIDTSIAEVNTKNKLKAARASVTHDKMSAASAEQPPHQSNNASKTKAINTLAGRELAAVSTASKNMTIAKNMQLTQNELFYFADHDKSKFYTITNTPLSGEGIRYSTDFSVNASNYTAESRTEKISLDISLDPIFNTKFYDLTVHEKSEKSRSLSLTAYFEIANISRYNISYIDGKIELDDPVGNQKFYLMLPSEGVSYTFSRREFFGRLNNCTNPRGVLETLKGERDSNGCIAVKVRFLGVAGEKRLRFTLSASKYVPEETQKEIVMPTALLTTNNEAIDSACSPECLSGLINSQRLYTLGFKNTSSDIPALNTIATMHIDKIAAKNEIFALCRNQLMRGDMRSRLITVIESGEVVRESVNPLYLPLLVAEYVETSGEDDFLNATIKYSYLGNTDGEIGESIFNHCLRAIRYFSCGKDGLILTRNEDIGTSILYFATVKRFLKYITNRQIKLNVISNMERIREALMLRFENSAIDELKMNAYLAGILDFSNNPSAWTAMEEYVDSYIIDKAQKGEYSAILYKLILSRVFGIRFFADMLHVKPHLMKNLNNASAEIVHGGGVYKISIKRTGISRMIIGGVNYINMEYISLKKGEKKEIFIEI